MDLNGSSRKTTVYNMPIGVHYLIGTNTDAKKGSFFVVMLLHFNLTHFSIKNALLQTKFKPAKRLTTVIKKI